MAIKPLSSVHLRLPKLYYTQFVSCREEGEENKHIYVTEELSDLSVTAAAKQDGHFFKGHEVSTDDLPMCEADGRVLNKSYFDKLLVAEGPKQPTKWYK